MSRNFSFVLSPPPPLDSSSDLHLAQDDDSPLSTFSPLPSFETNEAHQGIKYSRGDGTSTIDGNVGKSEETGHEVTSTSASNTISNAVTGRLREVFPKASSVSGDGATPKAGTARRFEDTPKAGTAGGSVGTRQIRSSADAYNSNGTATKADTSSIYEATPKARAARRLEDALETGTASKRSGRKQDRNKNEKNFAVANKNEHSNGVNHLSTPSWDIDQTFSFRKEKGKKQEPRHQRIFGQSTISGIWDMMSTIGQSRSEMSSDEDSIEENRPSYLTESGENDLFALEVGLMYSADEGDTINDPSTLSQTLSASFTIQSETSAQHPPAYDLAKYLRYRRQNGVADGSIQNDDDATNGEESTLYTAGQSTVCDDHGNKVPENAKMILGYENAKRRKTSKKRQHKNHFPTVKTETDPAEMERRLRELAGRINADWGGSAFMPPALARRLRDFQFAREKRRKKYGKSKPWGILGLYDHLSGVKIDVEWAEDAAWRRTNKHPYLTWCDFEATKNEGFNRPFFTFFTVSSCTAMMFTSLYVNGWKFEPISVNPMIGPSAETLLTLGAKDSYLIVVEHEIWRLVSPMVLHAGLIHFFLNMFALWFVGKAIEQVHGFYSAAVQFVVPAIGGTILSAIFLPEYITVGASGGIFGLIGACTADIAMNWNLLFNEFVNERGARISHARVLVVLFLDIVLNCLIGLTPFVDNFTHLGGMIYGFLCGLGTIELVSPRFFGDERRCLHECRLFFFRSIGLLVCLAGIIVSSIFLFTGDGDTNPCTSCTYMSCISFPPWAGTNEKWWYCDDCSRASAEGTLDMTTGQFTELSISCPNGSTETLSVDESWPQNEIGLEGILPSLCREHCLW